MTYTDAHTQRHAYMYTHMNTHTRLHGYVHTSPFQITWEALSHCLFFLPLFSQHPQELLECGEGNRLIIYYLPEEPKKGVLG